jgi:protocatechuate 3,4-dioxygenase, alpha subunit
MGLVPIPAQTVGPFFHLGLTSKGSIGCLAGPDIRGERVKLICTVLDGDGKPIDDGMIEIWQANADGKYNHPEDTQEKPIEAGFLGFGRLPTDESGVCVFETIKPGRVPAWAGAEQAPHLNLSIFARGVLKRLATRVYFSGDPANVEDPVLALVPEQRRDTLMANPDPLQPGVWRFDIHLCGERESVFFDV